MTQPSERLYQLLPSFYRLRDAAQGEPLRALLGVLEEERVRLESDVAGLYTNWFVETCDEWVLPYLDDLIGARQLPSVSSRAFTANSLAHRRRKGTLRTLEAVARDVTGWPARAVEFIQLVAATQNVNSERPAAVGIPDLRSGQTISLIASPFEQVARTVDVRSSGKYQTSQVGLFLWRLEAYPMEGVQAAPVDSQNSPGYFRVNPLGSDQALWSPRDTGLGTAAATQESSVPQPIRLRALYDALETHRQTLADGRTPHNPYFDRQPVLRLLVPGPTPADPLQAILPEQIVIADLSSWWTPASTKSYVPSQGGAAKALPIAVAVDPVLGRLAFPKDKTPAKVWVSYYYGSTSELGGGGYDRQNDLPDLDGDPATKYLVLKPGDPDGVLSNPLPFPSLSATDARRRLVIEIPDSQNYAVAPQQVPSGMQLELRARNQQRPLLRCADGTQAWRITLQDGASLVCNGLLLPCDLTLSPLSTDPAAPVSAAVSLIHCTVVPGHRVSSPTAFTALSINIDSSIIGALGPPTGASLTASTSGLAITASDSILDGAGFDYAVQAHSAQLQHVTVFGAVNVDLLFETSDSLFCGPVKAPQTKLGTISYCYLPNSPELQPFRCQPDVAVSESTASPDQVRSRVVPWFTSSQYGTPGYGQLDSRCAPEIRRGASDDGELGALHHLYEAQREDNLLACRDDYVRFGMTLNLFYAT